MKCHLEVNIDNKTDELFKSEVRSHLLDLIPEYYSIRLLTSKDTITHTEYTHYVSLCYQIAIEKDSKYVQLHLLIIPSKPITPQYSHVCIGGTFDRLHCGHISLFLSALFSCNEFLQIGISADELLQNKAKKELIQSYSEREGSITAFINEVKKYINLCKITILPLHDGFGVTVSDPSVNALVVSPETMQCGPIVNKNREEIGHKPLDLIVIELIMQGEQKVSSSFLRK